MAGTGQGTWMTTLYPLHPSVLLLLLWHIRSANICWITFWVPGVVLFPGESEMNQTEHQTSWCSQSAGELGPKSLALIKYHQAQKWKWLILLLACVEIGSRVNWGNAWEDSPRALIDELPRKQKRALQAEGTASVKAWRQEHTWGHLPIVHSGWSRGSKVLRAGDSPGNEAYLEVGWTWKQPLEIWLWSRRQSRINKNSSLQAFGKKTLAQTPRAFSVINGILTEAPFHWADRRRIHSCHCDAQHHWHVPFPQLYQRWCPVPRILHKAYLQGALQSHHPLAVWPRMPRSGSGCHIICATHWPETTPQTGSQLSFDLPRPLESFSSPPSPSSCIHSLICYKHLQNTGGTKDF